MAKKITAKMRRDKESKLAANFLKRNLKEGMDRNMAMRVAAYSGAKLADIAKVVGLTKQGVSWIVGPKRRHRE